MTDTAISGTSATELDLSQQATSPAPGADEQKPTDAPASEADAQNTEPEAAAQEAKKEESRRARSNARKAQALADARAEAKLYKEQLERALAEKQGSQQASAEPKREDFEDFEKYLEARADYRADQKVSERLKSEREAQQGNERRTQEAAGQAKIAQSWTEREKAFQASKSDYDDVATAFTERGGEIETLSREARMALVESEVGPALLYHLAKNPDDLDRLADLSPASQIRELGKLETKVSMPAKRTTSAPAPANITKGGATAEKDPSKMDQVQYEAWRKSQGARFT